MSSGPLIVPFRGVFPRIAASAFIAPGAVIIGDVEIGENANIWFGCVLRGDVSGIRVGARTNIQDGTVVHAATGKPPTWIGADITIGHLAMVHACHLEDGCFIGMTACVMDEAVVETGAMIAAGALVGRCKRIPAGQLWSGVPARFMRVLDAAEQSDIPARALQYCKLAQEYRDA